VDTRTDAVTVADLGTVLDATYRLWVNDARTVLVRIWSNGSCEVATRETPNHTWGPPVYLAEEKV